MSGEGNMPLEGDGKTEVWVGHEKGKVIWRFPRPVAWVGLDPDNAMAIVGATVHSAMVCKTGQAPRNGSIQGMLTELQGKIRKDITKQQRDALVNRVVLMMGNLQERHKKPLYIAEQIVDIVLSTADF